MELGQVKTFALLIPVLQIIPSNVNSRLNVQVLMSHIFPLLILIFPPILIDPPRPITFTCS